MQKSESFLQSYLKLENSDQRDKLIDENLDQGTISAMYRMDRDIDSVSPSEEPIDDEQGVIMLFDDGSSLLAFHSESQSVSHYVPIETQTGEDHKELIETFCSVSSFFEEDVKKQARKSNPHYFSIDFLALGAGFISLLVLAFIASAIQQPELILLAAIPYAAIYPVYSSFNTEDF